MGPCIRNHVIEIIESKIGASPDCKVLLRHYGSGVFVVHGYFETHAVRFVKQDVAYVSVGDVSIVIEFYNNCAFKATHYKRVVLNFSDPDCFEKFEEYMGDLVCHIYRYPRDFNRDYCPPVCRF